MQCKACPGARSSRLAKGISDCLAVLYLEKPKLVLPGMNSQAGRIATQPPATQSTSIALSWDDLGALKGAALGIYLRTEAETCGPIMKYLQGFR